MNKNFNKAVLIFSHTRDFSTLEVIKWLKANKKKYYLISSFDDFNNYGIKLNRNFIEKNICSVWFRKITNPPIYSKALYPLLNTSINLFLTSELEHFYNALDDLLTVKKLGNGFKMMDVNKIHALFEAKKVGLKTPEYLIATDKTELASFMKNKTLITKPLFNATPIQISEIDTGYMYTSLINSHTMSNIPDFFFPSFFQEFILKEFEVRVFYLDGEFYSAAIYSEINGKAVDYRNSSEENLRIVPYNLPLSIRNKIIRLMSNLNLNTGSIDLLKTTSNEYYFLEVNPCGQYESISSNCNFQLNKKIAEWLIN